MARHRGPARAQGPSQRQLRVGEGLRHVLAELLLRGEVHDPLLSDSQLTVSENWSVVPMRTEFVNPGEPVARMPGISNRAMPNVFGCPAMLPLGIPRSLFFAMPKSDPNCERSNLLTPSRNSS